MARRAKRQVKRSGAYRLGWLIGRAIVLFVGGSVLWVLIYKWVPPPVTFTMLGGAMQGHGIAKDWTSLDRIDPAMPRAAIAAEDARFCSHHGFDAEAIRNAFVRNQEGGRIRGGSTISQQAAKNAFLWQGGAYFRKGLEAWFTVLIEGIWGKRRIMEVYLNLAETGIGTYGVEAGSQRYFHHSAARMSSIEAARMAAVLPLPKKRDAVVPKGYVRRYGNAIAARANIVRREGMDACLK
jgi:monofunctional biosynthetic peptidoglycan transglycosylase